MSARKASTGHRSTMRDDVSSLTLRLVGDYPEVPAGSVMRCVARAVRRAVLVSAPPEQIPTRAESAVREAMARRLAPAGGATTSPRGGM